MSSFQSSAPHRVCRFETVSKASSRPKALPRESSSKSRTKWTSDRNDTDVIKIRNLLHLHSTDSAQTRANRIPSIDDRVIINICGDRYETHRTTLEFYPETLLGNPKRRKDYYDPVHEEYFFDRHRPCFQAILYYYQSCGRLRRPDYIPLDIFLEEVTFFQLGQEALNQIRKDENINEVKKVRLPKNYLRRWLWATMEFPDYSCLAKVVNILSLMMVLISTLTLAVESLPQYTHSNDFHCRKQQKLGPATFDSNDTGNLSSPVEFYICQWYYMSPFFIIQLICVAFFTIELFLRLISTPSLIDFAKDPMNWIDLSAILPFFITMGIRISDRDDQVDMNTYVGLRLLRVLRLARVFKFCRVVKNVKSLRVLATTIRQSLIDFVIIIILLTLLGFLFGSAAYYAENDSNSVAFDSIPKATYWGIVTITSVGYGDITPITPIGRIIGCLCALFGAATIGMLVSVLVDRYQRVYVQKLYFQEEQIDFSDFSDEDNNEPESKQPQHTSVCQRNSKIEDPDARAKQSVIEKESEEDSVQSNSGRIRFIIGFTDDDRQKVSDDFLKQIDPVVAEKRMADENISASALVDHTVKQSHPFDVRYNLNSFDDCADEEGMTSNDCTTRLLRSFDPLGPQTDGMLNGSERFV